MEKWLSVKGYEGIYEVSDHGNVRSLDRLVWNKANHKFQKTKGIVLKPKKSKFGYLIVTLYDAQSNSKMHLVHRLVMRTFFGELSTRKYVNHIDGNKENNHLSNLEWCTPGENNRHAFETGLKKSGGDRKQAKLTNENVSEARKLYASRHYSMGELAIKYGVSEKAISNALHGRTFKNVPMPEYNFEIGKDKKPKKLILSASQINEAKEMLASGYSKRKVAQNFNVSHTTINRLVK